jgi:hypothetical protein
MLKRICAAAIAAVGWYAIAGQFFQSPSAGNYFSYFTVLSNLLVAVTTTLVALAPESAPGRFFQRPLMATSVALYITVTGLVYWLILSRIYHLEGWVLFFDELLHYVIPPAFVLFWLVFIPKGTLDLRHLPWMLVAPIAYGAYTLVRGPLVDWYPYPFIDVSKLGYPTTFRNIVEFTIFFAFVGSIYVQIDHAIGRMRRTT